MQVIKHWSVGTEDGRTYYKYFFDTNHTAICFLDLPTISFFGPKGNKTNKYDTVVNGSKAISNYLENIW